MKLRKLPVLLSALVLPLIIAACADSDPKDLTFDLEIAHRALVGDVDVLKATQDDNVTIVVNSDERVSFHLHGYDIEETAEPGKPATLGFVANATGSFPFTIHVGGGEEAHGATFQSNVLNLNDSFFFHVPHNLTGKEVPYHSHLHAELSGTIVISEDAPQVTQANIEIHDKAVHPHSVTVRPDTEIVWTNKDTVPHLLASGHHPDAVEGGHGHDEEEEEDDEVELGRLEVQPK